MQKRKLISIVFLFLLMVFLSSTCCFAAPKNGFQEINQQKKYYDDATHSYKYKKAKVYYRNGVKVKGWQQINGKTYFFDSDYTLHYGWMSKDMFGKRYVYHMDTDTGVMSVGKKYLKDGKLYYFNKMGEEQYGLIRINGRLYSFSADGAEGPGWQKSLNQSEKLRYFKENHVAACGWYTVNGQKYHFGTNGFPHTGLYTLRGETYYLGKRGVMQTGWIYLNNHWYYFDKKTGAMAVRNTRIDGKTYKFNSNGICTNKTSSPSSSWNTNQTIKEDIGRFSDGRNTMIGQLQISNYINVRLVKTSTNFQYVTDCFDTAAWIDQGNIVYIADHYNQDFYYLNKVNIGTYAYINNGKSTARYVCIEAGYGTRNSGSMHILDKRGISIGSRKNVDFCTYTCTPKGNGYIDTHRVFYAVWRKA